jgi:hypothetical protein
MQYGILKDILLLSTYIPSKHPEFCEDELLAVAKEERIFIELRKDEIKKIISKIKEIKQCYEKDYKNIQKESYDKVEQNLKIREAREEKDRLLKEAEAGKDSRHNSTSTRLWIQNVGSAIQTTFVNILNVAIFAKDILISPVPLFKAIFQNKVIMGFLIIVSLIILMLYSLKPSSSNNKNGGNAKTNSMSTFSPYTIYIDVIDSYKHYSKMAKDLSNTMSNTLSNNEEGKDQEIIDDTIYDRELHDSKKKKGRYDNLSYINLGEIGITTQEFTIEKDKYYNINLPSSKFKITKPDIKWKTYEKDVEHKGEIKWKIDCEKIDTVKDDTSPAFITDTDDDNKCIINVRGFDNKKKSSADNEEDTTVYSTEEIKYE